MDHFQTSLQKVYADSLDRSGAALRVVNPGIAQRLAEVEKPIRDAKLAKWRTKGEIRKVISSLISYEEQEKKRQQEIEESSQMVLHEVSAEFEKQMDGILSLLKEELVTDGITGPGDIPYKTLSIGWEKIKISFYYGYQSISFGSPKDQRSYKPNDPNSLEVLRIIQEYIEENPETCLKKIPREE